MNWYTKISQLDPGAWNKHDTTHRLSKDQPFVTVMPGIRIPQETRPKEDLEKDYFGVHATPDINLASVYANNIGSFDNPPIIFEISTTQKWDIDVDAIMNGFDEVMVIDSEMDDLVERVENAENIDDTISDIMDEISNMELYDEDYVSDNDFSDQISEKAGFKHPRAIVDYFQKYYRDPVQGFYQRFILPLWFQQGDLDDSYKAYFIGQQRFTTPITIQEITAIYTIYPYEYEFRKGYSEDEKDNYTEEGKYIPDYEDVDYGLNIIQIWNNPQAQLFPEIFEVTYHGTNAERAKQAFPQLSQHIDKAKEILNKEKMGKTAEIIDTELSDVHYLAIGHSSLPMCIWAWGFPDNFFVKCSEDKAIAHGWDMSHSELEQAGIETIAYSGRFDQETKKVSLTPKSPGLDLKRIPNSLIRRLYAKFGNDITIYNFGYNYI